MKKLEESKYARIGRKVGELVTQKQAAYGDSFGKSQHVLALLYPNGIPPEQFQDALTVTRIIDKLFRIATDRDAMGETPWRDIAGYAILAVERAESEESEELPPQVAANQAAVGVWVCIIGHQNKILNANGGCLTCGKVASWMVPVESTTPLPFKGFVGTCIADKCPKMALPNMAYCRDHHPDNDRAVMEAEGCGIDSTVTK